MAASTEPRISSINQYPTLNHITTGSGNDTVHIAKAPGLDGLRGMYAVTINGVTQMMSKEQLQGTVFELGEGDDRLFVDPDVDATITARGGDGSDILIGGAGNDLLDGGTGADYVVGGGGWNRLFAGFDGDHDLLVGNGQDYVEAGKKDSVLTFGGDRVSTTD